MKELLLCKQAEGNSSKETENYHQFGQTVLSDNVVQKNDTIFGEESFGIVKHTYFHTTCFHCAIKMQKVKANLKSGSILSLKLAYRQFSRFSFSSSHSYSTSQKMKGGARGASTYSKLLPLPFFPPNAIYEAKVLLSM